MITVILGILLTLLYGYLLAHLPLPLGLGLDGLAVFVHVPCAWVGSLFLALSALYSWRYLRARTTMFDAQAVAAARVGLLFSLLATVTGAVFARYTWGHYWNWDPRQTTMAIILMIYLAYFALRSSIDRSTVRAGLSAAYAGLAGLLMPLFVYVLPRVYQSLHPSPVIAAGGKVEMESSMLLFLIAASIGFTVMAARIWRLDWRTELRLRK